MTDINPDTIDNSIRRHPELLQTLLLDHTRSASGRLRHIIWATDSYQGYRAQSEMKLTDITGTYERLIQPRIAKTRSEQKSRTRDKAEVFTPRDVVSYMNQSLDWQSGHWPVDTENWQDYVKELRLEITCGEAPFIVGRYNALSGRQILKLDKRAGFLDRKLQVVSRFCTNEKSWLTWAKRAYRASYGYEWQGDNLLLARENLLYSFIDYWNAQFPENRIDLAGAISDTHLQILQEIAEIISWNIFQMDGLKYVLPMSCKEGCIGCDKQDIHRHNGKYAKIMDWETGKPQKFIHLLAQ